MKNRSFINLLFAAFLALTAIACQPSATNVTINTGNSNANANAAATVTPVSENKTTISPDSIVADLYKQHDAEKSPFYQTKDRALVEKYFSKATADKIWKDAKDSEADGGVGALGADPLYNAQDTEIKNFKVGQADIKGEKATVPVTFENFGKKYAFDYSLVKENDNWKINDIKYDGGLTLLKLFKDNAAAESDEKSSSSSDEFEGKYQIGDTFCTVKPIKMAFEIKWEKGTGTEIFFSEGEANDKFIFASEPKTGKANVFSFNDENYNTGIFYRADGKEFPIKRVK